MANHKSAIKRDRQNKIRRLRNRTTRSNVRTLAKKVLDAVESGDKESAVNMLREATKKIDKAAAKGVLKKNSASRKIARLAKRVNATEANA